MRRLFVLAALCMVGALVFAPVAGAQSSSASAGAEQTPDSPCPTDIDEFPLGTQCGEGGGYITPDDSSVAPVITADSSFEECDGGPSVETPDGTRCLPDVSADATETATAVAEEDTASATAEADDESATETADASEDVVEALPATGGPAFALVLAPAALLLANGLVALRVVRRG